MKVKTWALALLMTAQGSMTLASSVQDPEENNSTVQALRLLPPEIMAEIITHLPLPEAHNFSKIAAHLGAHSVDPIMIKGWQIVRDFMGDRLNAPIAALAPEAQRALFQYVLETPPTPLPAEHIQNTIIDLGDWGNPQHHFPQPTFTQEMLFIMAYGPKIHTLCGNNMDVFGRYHIIDTLGRVDAEKRPIVMTYAQTLITTEMKKDARAHIIDTLGNTDSHKIPVVVKSFLKFFNPSLDGYERAEIIDALKKFAVEKIPVVAAHASEIINPKIYLYGYADIVAALGSIDIDKIPFAKTHALTTFNADGFECAESIIEWRQPRNS